MRRTPMRRRPADNHLSGAEWDQVLHLLMVRSGLMCEAIGPTCTADRSGSLRDLNRDQVEIQHRRARGMGGTSLAGTNQLDNLLLLCRSCHRWVEARPPNPGGRHLPGVAEQRGLWIRHGRDRDGNPVPAGDYPLVLASGRRVLLHPTNPAYDPHPDEWGLFTPAAG